MFRLCCIYIKTDIHWSCGSAVGIANSYGLDDRGVGVRFPVKIRIFNSSYCPDRLQAPLNLLSNGHWSSFAGVKWPEREANHSPPTITEVKKTWAHVSTPR
jgi:hypothetical protein